MQTQAPASMHCKVSSAKQQYSSSYRLEDNGPNQQLLPPQIPTHHVSTKGPTLYDVVQQQKNITAQ